MKLSRKKSWTIPTMKSDPASPQYPPVPERHDDSDDEDNDVERSLSWPESLVEKYRSWPESLVKMELTDLDKLYLALAETGQDYAFNTLYYFLNITSIKALKEYNPNGNNYLKVLQLSDGFISTVKYNICDKDFDFQQLAVKSKHSNVTETCSKKGIPVIKREDLKEVKPMTFGPEYHVVVCQAQWTRPDGRKENVCLRYHYELLDDFLHEADISSLLRHPNILPLHGVVISSSFSSSVALVVEFAEYGNLHESKAQLLSMEQLC